MEDIISCCYGSDMLCYITENMCGQAKIFLPVANTDIFCILIIRTKIGHNCILELRYNPPIDVYTYNCINWSGLKSII